MKASDLMISDYILAKPSMMLIQVAAVHNKKIAYHAVTHKLNWVRECLLMSIPITPEILERNGFKPIYHDDKSAYKWKEYDDDDNYQSVIIDFRVKRLSEVWNEKTKKYYKGEILYLHELQHVLKLCGILKTIEP